MARPLISILVSLALMIGAWVYASALLFGGPEGFKAQTRITRVYLEGDRAFPFTAQESALSGERADAFIQAQTASLPRLRKTMADLGAASSKPVETARAGGESAAEAQDFNGRFAEAMMDFLPVHAAALYAAEMSLQEYRWIEQQIQGTLRRAAETGDHRLDNLAEAMRRAAESVPVPPSQSDFRYTFDFLQSRTEGVKDKHYGKDVEILSARLPALIATAPCVLFDSFLESLYAPKSASSSLVWKNAPTRKIAGGAQESDTSSDDDM